MMYYDYIIAGLRLRTDIDLVDAGIRGFRPFAVDVEGDANCLVERVASIDVDSLCLRRTLSTSYIAEAKANSSFSRTKTGYLYSIQRDKPGSPMVHFHIERDTGHVITDIVATDSIDVSIMRFGIWVMFGVVLASHSAIAIHSSTIVARGRAVLFLGESGTGKSTHTRLWREHIPHAKLLNDDSPIIRIVDGQLRVYGSPWSGKTPCYKNESYPIAAFCRLVQAPQNMILQQSVMLAIGAILPSCPPIFAHDEYLQDCICTTLDTVITDTPVFRLECLPNAEAAKLSYLTTIILTEDVARDS